MHPSLEITSQIRSFGPVQQARILQSPPAPVAPTCADLRSSYRPEGGLAAASTEVRLRSIVVMPALAMEMVCCSMACLRITMQDRVFLNFHHFFSGLKCPPVSQIGTGRSGQGQGPAGRCPPNTPPTLGRHSQMATPPHHAPCLAPRPCPSKAYITHHTGQAVQGDTRPYTPGTSQPWQRPPHGWPHGPLAASCQTRRCTPRRRRPAPWRRPQGRTLGRRGPCRAQERGRREQVAGVTDRRGGSRKVVECSGGERSPQSQGGGTMPGRAASCMQPCGACSRCAHTQAVDSPA